MRICILLAKSVDPTTEQDALGGVIPRPEYLVLREALDADILDFSDVADSVHPTVVRARRRGLRFGLAALGFIRRKEYDHFYCTGEDIAFPFATAMSAVGDFCRTTAVIHNSETRNRHIWMTLLPSRVWHSIICIGEEQYRVVTEINHVPRKKVHLFPFWVDTKFFDPRLVERHVSDRYVFSCGRESRDYRTLQNAASASQLSFQIVASGWAPHSGFDAVTDLRETSNVRIHGRVSYEELRALYGGAQVVAVPVVQTSYGAGVTSIAEAMCMQRPVVVSAARGIVDYVDHGVVGLQVPVGDAEALRDASEKLFDNPELAEEMGHRGRERALEKMRIELHAHRTAALLGLVPRVGPLTDGV